MTSMFWLYGAENLFGGLDSVYRAVGSVISLDLTSVFRLGCITRETALAAMMAQSLPPLGLAFLVMLLQMTPPEAVSTDAKRLCASAVVFYWLCVFPTVSVKLFRVWRGCDQFDDDGTSYMLEDYSTECHGHLYRQTIAYAWSMVIVYPFGVPLTAGLVLYSGRRRIGRYQEGKGLMRDMERCIQQAQQLLQVGPALADHTEEDRRGVLAQGRAIARSVDRIDRPLHETHHQADATVQAVSASLGGYALRRELQQLVDLLKNKHERMEQFTRNLVAKDGGPSGRSHILMATGYELYAYYDVWWWELFETARKLLVIGGVVVFSPTQPQYRASIALGAEVLGLWLCGVIRPYRSRTDNVLAQVFAPPLA